MMDSVNEATATASPVRAGGPTNRSSGSREKLRSSEVYAWTLSGLIIVEDTEVRRRSRAAVRGAKNCRALVVGRMLGLLTLRRGL